MTPILPPDTSGLTVLRGDGSWPWNAYIDGDDIIVVNARATCFGGGNDPQDNGETASGLSTKMNPSFVGCALPMIYTGTGKAFLAALGGSPIPRIPWRSQVIITETATAKSIITKVIDLGPGKRTGNAIDLTVAAAKLFNPHATSSSFELACHYRILDAARYAPKGSRA